MLVIGLGPMVVKNPKEATKIIAENVISDSDWQIGHSKIFLKVGEEDYSNTRCKLFRFVSQCHEIAFCLLLKYTHSE